MSAPEYPSTPNYPASTTDQPGDSAASLAEAAQHDLAELGEEVKHQAAALGEEAKAQIGEVAEKAKGMASEQKDLIFSQMSGISDALEKVATELEQQNQSSAHYARMVADGAARLTSTVGDNDVDQILSMAQDFGRKQPAAFMGLAALLGFAASRFAMSSAPRPVAEARPDNRAATAPSYEQSVGGNDAGI